MLMLGSGMGSSGSIGLAKVIRGIELADLIFCVVGLLDDEGGAMAIGGKLRCRVNGWNDPVLDGSENNLLLLFRDASISVRGTPDSTSSWISCGVGTSGVPGGARKYKFPPAGEHLPRDVTEAPEILEAVSDAGSEFCCCPLAASSKKLSM